MKSQRKSHSMNKKSIEEEKLDLVKLRLRNKFYEKSNVLDKVVREILKNEINKSD